MEHTPAPWTVSDKFPTHVYKWLDKGAFRIVATCDCHEKNAVAESDARLIASSPDLLEALERVINDVDSVDYHGGISDATHIIISNLIKKAKGL